MRVYSSQPFGKSMMGREFDDFVQKHHSFPGRLPSTHATDTFTARKIFKQKQELAPSQCPVFKELLLYFFYGRVAYRVHPNEPANALTSYAPVCFVLKPAAVANAKRIYPFDTGAFEAKFYENSMHHKMERGDFEVSNGDESPQRIVKAFFGTNKDYIENKPCLKAPNDPLDLEVESFIALINDPTKNTRDDRVSAIEIQVDRSVPLSGNLLAAILPNNLRTTWLIPELRKISATPLFYSITNRMKPSESVGSLTNTLYNYFESEKYI